MALVRYIGQELRIQDDGLQTTKTSAPSVQFAEFNPVLILQYYEVSSSWEAAGDTLLREDFENLPLILKR